MNYSVLPHLNAFLNATSGILILAGFFFISRRRIAAHLACMIAAVSVSILFLVSYVVYHYNHGSTRFMGQGVVRPIYFTVLVSHTVLAACIVPLIVLTLRRALRREFGRHQRLARWTFPLWLYVSITGVIVYLMLYHLYPQR